VKFFLWKLLHHGLPIGSIIRFVTYIQSCFLCGEDNTMEHIMWSGCVVCELWKGQVNEESVLSICA